MSDPLRERADRRFEEALKAADARDPRDFYRARLRELKERSPESYRRAVAYYEERLIPAVADEASDPLAEWLEYGRVLVSLTAPGRTVQIDPTGRSRDYARPVPADALVLHLPEGAGQAALVLGLPAKLSPAQRASYELLVKGSLG
ncbi:MAG: hypothetical protein M3P24_11695 [Gemmatimonadota bacterium]|nr:hypothetical protein [Gemmatimonadota bacterium]